MASIKHQPRPRINSPTLAGTVAGTYTLGGTPTLTSPTINAPAWGTTPTGDNGPKWVTGSLTNTQMVNLRATPVELIAAPGAGKVIKILGGMLFFDRTAAYTETAANLVLKYTDGSGVACSEIVEATGFVDAGADTATSIIGVKDTIVAKTGCDNKAVVIHNNGAGEYGSGNAANVVRYAVQYVTLAAGW